MEKSAAAKAVGGKTARACDSCLRRRARWYCAADDAFLCQICDSSVHAANQLARRHHRVRLKTSSSSSKMNLLPPSDLNSAVPAWHRRKARTPRHGRASVEVVSKPPVLLVPDLEVGNKNLNEDEEEEQLIYRVPIFDPVLKEFCSPPAIEEIKLETSVNQVLPVVDQNTGFNELYQSELELAEFAANVENLLGQDLNNDSFCIDGLGLLETKDDDEKNQVKMEITDVVDPGNFLVDMEMEFSQESLEFNFDYGSVGEEAEEKKVETVEEHSGPMKIRLRLDYDAVIDVWSCQGCSPWTDGERPQFKFDDCWPDFTIPNVYGGAEAGGLYRQVGNNDGGREARVSRYREKRRTRLFSKKIRYEVRKLNAEKRPRMKGRFIKRASFNAAGAGVGGSGAFPYV